MSPSATRSLRLLLAGFGLAAIANRPLAAKTNWDPIDPAELAESAPKIDPAAAAEVIFRKITINDRDYPDDRTVSEYVRYKVFDPEKATNITRVSARSISFDGTEL